MNPKLLNIIKRRKKYLHFFINLPVRSKAKTPDKSKLQLEFIKQMKLYNKKTLKNDIAVQIITYTTDKKSPSIDKWSKNIIDILHKKEYLLEANDSIWLPFEDDKQIRYLFIKYIYAGNESATHIDIL